MTGGVSSTTISTVAELKDAEARRDVGSRLDANLFVEAGAGSGKTSSLVERVVTLVTQGGVDVADVAAITFTEAAARELRTRVRDRLVAEGIDGAEVEAATFTTLHSFALRILLAYPVESGLPPGFAVLDEVRSVLDFERGWREFQGRLGDDMSLLDLQQRAGALDPKLINEKLVPVARSFDENWDRVDSIRRAVESRVPDTELWSQAHPVLSPIDFSAELAAVTELMGYCQGCTDPTDKLFEKVKSLVTQVQGLETADPIDQLQALSKIKPPKGRVGRKDNWTSPTVDEMRDLVGSAWADVAAAVESCRQEVLTALQALVEVHVAGEVRRRHAAGTVSFHDLLVLAKLLVRANEPIRRRLHDRYRCILLDEFQDTDPLQIELAAVIASSTAPGGRSWRQLMDDIEPGRLTVVGDPKQSIYRFRRADMGVYLRTGEAMTDGATELSTNFRSVPGIVDFVNDFFSRRFIDENELPESDDGLSAGAAGQTLDVGYRNRQPGYRPLTAHRSPCPEELARRAEASGGHPVVVLGQMYDKDEANAERLRDLEAADIAGLVCTVVQQRWPVYRRDKEAWGDARLSDIAILIPSRLSLPSLETAFQAANIPLRPETNSLVYSTQEIRDVMAVIRAVVAPGSSIDVAATLRSSVFAVDDESLLQWKLADGSWDYREPAPAGFEGSAIDEAFDCLRRWRAQRWWIEPAHLIDQIVQERRLRELALLHARPRDRLRRYRFLAEQARLFAETEAGDLGDFVDWVEIQSSDVARITEPVPPEPDDDAVRVLTVHGAKGLEFPIAVMAGAPTSVSGPRLASVLYSDQDELSADPVDSVDLLNPVDPEVSGASAALGPDASSTEIRLSVDNQTEGFDARASVEKVLDAHERIRLQYVAATRARDYLVVCTHHNNRGTSVGRETWNVLQGIPEVWRSVSVDRGKVFRDEPTQLRIPEGNFVGARESWLAEQERVLDGRSGPNRWSATSIAAKLASDNVAAAEGPTYVPESEMPESEVLEFEVPESEAPGSRGLGADFGTAVHHVLELVPFPDAGSAIGPGDSVVRQLSQACATSAGVPELGQQVAERATQALQSDTVTMAANSRHWRELTVSMSWPSGTFDGVIDLVVETDDGLVVVDYKTDHLQADGLEVDLEAKVARYRHQVAAYALAVERLLPGRAVVEGRLLFLAEGGVYDRAVLNLSQAKAEVATLIGLDESPEKL